MRIGRKWIKKNPNSVIITYDIYFFIPAFALLYVLIPVTGTPYMTIRGDRTRHVSCTVAETTTRLGVMSPSNPLVASFSIPYLADADEQIFIII